MKTREQYDVALLAAQQWLGNQNPHLKPSFQVYTWKDAPPALVALSNYSTGGSWIVLQNNLQAENDWVYGLCRLTDRIRMESGELIFLSSNEP